MFLLSTYFTLLVALVAASVTLAINTGPIDYYLSVDFTGSFQTNCSGEVMEEINMHALKAFNFLMREHAEDIGGNLHFDSVDEVRETMSNPIEKSDRELVNTVPIPDRDAVVAMSSYAFSLKFRSIQTGRCRGCKTYSSMFNDAVRTRRGRRGLSEEPSWTLADVFETELTGMLGLALDDEFSMFECLQGATGLKVSFANKTD